MLAALLLVMGVRGSAPPPPAAAAAVFRNGEGGYHSFLNPALLRLDGAEPNEPKLLAFAEARRGDGSDASTIDVGFKASTDAGSTWSALRSIVANAGGSASPRGSSLQGNVPFVVGTANSSSAQRVVNMLGVNASLAWSVHSDDGGQTWSAPVDVSAQAKGAGEGWYATGPANGISLKQGKPGRILVPINTNMATGSIRIEYDLVDAAEGRNRPCPMASLRVGVRGQAPSPVPPYFSTAEVATGLRKEVDACSSLTLESLLKLGQRALVLISDDDGASWRRSSFMPLVASETAVAQLPDGTILARSRLAEKGWQDGCEHFTLSTDYGETWHRHNATPSCIDEPGVQNSMLGREHDVLLASPRTDCKHSKNEECRGNLTIYRSSDLGQSWQTMVTIHHPDTEYSSMICMDANCSGDTVGIAYVRGRSKTGGIVFSTFEIPQGAGDAEAKPPTKLRTDDDELVSITPPSELPAELELPTVPASPSVPCYGS
jgi:hypothetical protein